MRYSADFSELLKSQLQNSFFHHCILSIYFLKGGLTAGYNGKRKMILVYFKVVMLIVC
jgi:hypothetical protein